MAGNRHTIARLNVLIGAQTKEFEQAMKRSERKLGGFQKQINKLPGLIGGAFAVSKVAQFTSEAIKMAGVMDGVEKAFNRIDGANLNQLRSATKGTVSDLELMKAAVNARNFEIPFSKLGKLFQFATQRADETGQSVTQLVGDIITGLGRKSPLILDNLGISAVKLKERLNGVGLQSATTADITRALTEVIDEQNAAFGSNESAALSSGQQIQSLAASYDNLKTQIGKAINQSGIFQTLVGGTANALSKGNDVRAAKDQLKTFKDGAEALSEIQQKLKEGPSHMKLFGELSMINEAIEKREKLIKRQVTGILEDYKGQELQILNAYKQNIHYEQIRAGVLQALQEKEAKVNAEKAKSITLTEDQQKVVDRLNQDLLKLNNSVGYLNNEYSASKGKVKAYKEAIVELISQGVIPANTELKKLHKALSSEEGFKKSFEVEAIDPKKMLDREGLDMFKQFSGEIVGANLDLFELKKTFWHTREEVDLMSTTFESLGGSMVSAFDNMLTSGKVGIKSIMQMLKRLIARLAAAAAAAAILSALLPGGKSKLGNAFTFGEKFKTLFGGGFAKGGNPPIGKVSVVGERGPELIRPRSAMNVVPNHKLGGMGANRSIVVHLRGEFKQRGTDMVNVIDQVTRTQLRYSG